MQCRLRSEPTVRVVLALALLSLTVVPVAEGQQGHPLPAFTVTSLRPPWHASCPEGRTVSPALAWSGAPPGTKSFAVLMANLNQVDDRGGDGAEGPWWHWILYNIPATVTSLAAGTGDSTHAVAPAGSVPAVIYHGPCLADDDRHRYVLSVFALKVDTLAVPKQATAALVAAVVHDQALARAIVTNSDSR